MTTLRLVPTRSHCIETTSKKEYERLLTELLADEEEDTDKQVQLQLLLTFLDTADFSRLRTQCDALFADGKEVECLLSGDEHEVHCKITGK